MRLIVENNFDTDANATTCVISVFFVDNYILKL